jgi:group I intron endonuclease
MSSCGIYRLVNLINLKSYIGKTIDSSIRFSEHINSLLKNNHINEHLQKSWNKYGKSNFIFEFLEKCQENELDLREKYWITYYKTYLREYGYNKTFGGTGGKLTPESLKKMSNSLKGRTFSEEYKKNLSKIMIGKNSGENNGMYGKIPWNKGETKETSSIVRRYSISIKKRWENENHPSLNKERSEETKTKISNSLKGKKKSEKHKENLSLVNRGKILSTETRNKMSQSRKGIPQIKITCPYCNKTGGTTMHRWHFENCKLRNK